MNAEFLDLLKDLASQHTWLELALLAACIGLAYGVCRFFARGAAADSVWFGSRVLDGLLFPLLALVLTYAAKAVGTPYRHVTVLKLAVPVLVSLVAIRLLARVLSAVFPASHLVRLVERFMSWVAWLGAALWITGLAPAVLAELDDIKILFGKSHLSLLTLLEGIFSSGLVLVLTLWLSAAIESRVLREAVQDLSLRKIAVNATRALLLFVGLLFALSAVGVDLTALSVLGGALGVGIGLGLQKLAANYVSGFVVLFERSLRIGDNVKVDGFEGRITDIKTRYTVIRALNGREAIVPNEKMVTERIENLSLADPNVLVTVSVTVGPASDVAQVQAVLYAATQASPRVLQDPAPAAYLANFVPDGLEFTLAFWIADPENGQLNLRSAINIALLQGLRQAGIELPSPQRVVLAQA